MIKQIDFESKKKWESITRFNIHFYEWFSRDYKNRVLLKRWVYAINNDN